MPIIDRKNIINLRFLEYRLKALNIFSSLGLTIVAIATIFAGFQETILMIENSRVTLADLLLMFLYLEILSMVAIYFESGRLPVRLPLYIAIVAMARYVIVDIKEMESIRLLVVSASIVLVALAVLAIRYGHVRYQYPEDCVEEKIKPSNQAN